jgi:hypothetical protein
MGKNLPMRGRSEKFDGGPAVILIVFAPGHTDMGCSLAGHFIFAFVSLQHLLESSIRISLPTEIGQISR